MCFFESEEKKMYTHIGDDVLVRTKSIIGIFDLESATIEKATRDFLAKAEKENKVTYTSPRMPKCIVLADGTAGVDVYISSNTIETLRERLAIETSQYTED